MSKSARVLLPVLLLLGSVLSSTASARTLHHEVKGHKTHRLVAGSKTVRINNVGEVITKQP